MVLKIAPLALYPVFAALSSSVSAQTADAPMAPMSMEGVSNPATLAYMKAMEAMHQDMQATTPANDADKDFILMMKPHHHAAVDMAKAYLKYGHDPILTQMSKDIIAGQQKEIAVMDAWAKAHDLGAGK